jgi:oligosaccharide repeat unit polymerase
MPKKQILQKTLTYSKNFKIVLITVSILIAILFAKYVLNSMLKINSDEEQSIIASLIIKKSVFMLPVAAFALLVFKKPKITVTLILIGLIILFLKNPISERRNAIGPLYMAITFFMFSFLYKTNFKSYIFIFIIFFILFPLSSIITNSFSPLFERFEEAGNLISEGISVKYYENYFNTLHYDAWSNMLAAIEFVDQNSLSYGFQLLGGIFFFIPRILWPGKPIGSGHLLANDFLIPQHHLWLSNISCPYISEGYLNFGLAGIIIFTIVLSLFIKKVDFWVNSPDPLYKIFGIYTSFWLFYLLRGDLMSSWAYLCGAFIGIIIIPKTINRILLKKWN